MTELPLNNKCPICGNEIYISNNDYACVDKKCSLGNGANSNLKNIMMENSTESVIASSNLVSITRAFKGKFEPESKLP